MIYFYVSLKQKLKMEIKNLEFRVFKQIFKTEKKLNIKNYRSFKESVKESSIFVDNLTCLCIFSCDFKF
jgi:hypothetical protein